METTDITKHLLNGMSPGFFIAMMIIALSGVLVFFLSDVAYAVKNDKSTPGEFNIWFMFKSGFARVLLNFIILSFCIAYFGEISQIIFRVEEPLTINGVIALMLGIQIDPIAKKIVGYGKDGTRAIKNIFK